MTSLINGIHGYVDAAAKEYSIAWINQASYLV